MVYSLEKWVTLMFTFYTRLRERIQGSREVQIRNFHFMNPVAVLFSLKNTLQMKSQFHLELDTLALRLRACFRGFPLECFIVTIDPVLFGALKPNVFRHISCIRYAKQNLVFKYNQDLDKDRWKK